MFTRLFEPITINGCEIPNRLAVTAMVSNYCDENGIVSDKYIGYHIAKAKGGWGLIITEDYPVTAHAMGYSYVPGLWNDEQIEGNQRLTAAVHEHGSKIFCQIYHAGRQTNSHVNGGVAPVAPSPIPCPWLREMPRELTIPEIKQIVAEFGDTALRAKKSGFDGVEIHAAHGYLIAQFMSQWANKRTDEYGGPLTNRLRFIHEIYDDVRSKVGADYPVIIRFSMIEDVPGGRTMAEARILATEFEQWGFDALNLSCSVYGDFSRQIVSPMFVDPAWQADMAAEIKSLVKIPTFTVNRIMDPVMAESLLQAGKADIIGMGRQSLADPDTPIKAKQGRLNEIRPCISCLQGCTGALYVGGPIRCLVNPELGLETVTDYTPDPVSKLVYVAGGGPAGMEAARIAARKGHRVELFESRGYLGGQFVSAAYPPHKGGLSDYIAWSIRDLEAAGVKVHLETRLDRDRLAADKPDVLIVATGGRPTIPPIPGAETAAPIEDAILGTAPVGDRTVIIGGGECGCQTALHLAAQSRSATVLEMQPEILADVDGVNRYQQIRLLRFFDVPVHTEHRVVEIRPDGVTAETKTGERVTFEADTVLLAAGYTPAGSLADEAEGVVPDIRVVGGCRETSNAMIAIKEGFDAGLSLA